MATGPACTPAGFFAKVPSPDVTPSNPDSSETTAEPRLIWSGMTHVGRFRQNNEDSFLALTYDANEVRYLGKIGESSLEAGDFVELENAYEENVSALQASVYV
jgi:protein phosphatase